MLKRGEGEGEASTQGGVLGTGGAASSMANNGDSGEGEAIGNGQANEGDANMDPEDRDMVDGLEAMGIERDMGKWLNGALLGGLFGRVIKYDNMLPCLVG